MSRRQSIPSNVFYRNADPLPPLFPAPNEGDIYFNTTYNILRIFRQKPGTEILSWQDFPYAAADHTHASETEYWWSYADQSEMADPTSGKVRTNTPVGTPSTQIAISDVTARGVDASTTLSGLGKGDFIYFQKLGDAAHWGSFEISGDPVDNTTWWLLPVKPLAHNGTISKNQEVLVRFTYGGAGGGEGGGWGGISQELADSLYVNTLGDTMTGPLTLSRLPSGVMEAAPKQYVDNRTPKVTVAPTEPPLPTTGDIWIDSDELPADPYTKSESDYRYLQLAGGILQGYVTAHDHPTADFQLATKKYVDLNSGVGSVPMGRSIFAGSGLTQTPGSTLAADMTINVVGDATLSVTNDQISVVSAPKWTTPRTLTLIGDLNGSVTFDGSGAIPDLNASIASFSIMNADVNPSAAIEQTKILNLPTDLAAKMPTTKVTTAPTAPSSPTTGDIWIDTDEPVRVGMTVSEADAKYVPLDGATLRGFLSAHAVPSSEFHVATKGYVDSAAGVSLNRNVIAGFGLTGGGMLTSDVTLRVAGDGVTLSITEDQVAVLAAPKWVSSRTITLAGVLSGSTSFDGSAAIPSLAASIVAGSIVNADINSAAAIATTKVAGLDAALTGKLAASKVTTSDDPPATPATGDLWIDTNEPVKVGMTVSEADARFLKLTGGTMAGFLFANANPSELMHVATKDYVDTKIGGGVVTDHGLLTGLTDDDHSQYAKTDGTRGNFEPTGSVTTHNNSASAHSALLGAATPAVSDAGTAAVGSGTKFAREDHKHQVKTAAPVALGATNQSGSSTDLARADHIHIFPTKADIGLGSADNTADSAKPVSAPQQTALNLKADITYVDGRNPKITSAPTAPSSPASGDFWVDTDEPVKVGMTISEADAKYVQLGGGTLTGFLSAHANPSSAMHVATKDYVDNMPAGVPPTRTVSAGNGLTGGGDLSINRTISALAANGSISVAVGGLSVLSAPQWTTGRTITLTGDTTGVSAAFDGTAPLSFATVGVQAAKWTTGRTITLTGDITGTSAAWDGSAALSFATAIGAGVIVDADISAISTSKITGLDTALTNKADKSYVDARTPKITASTTAPSSPVTGDVWIVLP